METEQAIALVTRIEFCKFGPFYVVLTNKDEVSPNISQNNLNDDLNSMTLETISGERMKNGIGRKQDRVRNKKLIKDNSEVKFCDVTRAKEIKEILLKSLNYINEDKIEEAKKTISDVISYFSEEFE